MDTLVIFGGTFNPIHKGHVEILDALSELTNSKILLIPTKIPPHKETDFLAEETHRINMCKIIASRYNNVEVNDIELKRQGKSFTVDTVSELKKLYPEHKIALTIGADMLTSFCLWKDYDKLIKDVKIFAFNRANVHKDDFNCSLEKLREIGADISVIDKDITAVSSTEIRENIDKHFNLIDEEVYNYIIDNSVYGA